MRQAARGLRRLEYLSTPYSQVRPCGHARPRRLSLNVLGLESVLEEMSELAPESSVEISCPV